MISIHQSQFLPWIPYFFKILISDVFVVLNDVQFQKNGVQNRNQIKTPQGTLWFTVPVKVNLGDSINKVKVSNVKIFAKMLKTLEANYKKSQYYNVIFPAIEKAFRHENTLLHEINKRLLMEFLNLIGSDCKILFSSDIPTEGQKDDLVIETIKHIGDNDYLSGKGALDYMDPEKFKNEAIKVYTYDFTYEEYPQLWNKNQGFVPDLSILDLLFNYLPDAKDYILRNGKVKLLRW